LTYGSACGDREAASQVKLLILHCWSAKVSLTQKHIHSGHT